MRSNGFGRDCPVSFTALAKEGGGGTLDFSVPFKKTICYINHKILDKMFQPTKLKRQQASYL